MDASLVDLDLLRRQAKSEMQTGAAFPGECVSAPRIQDAASSRSEKSLVLASVRGNRSFPAVANHMRRHVGPCGRAACQDVQGAADMGASSDEDADFEAWAARRKAKKKGEKQEEEEEGESMGKLK